MNTVRRAVQTLQPLASALKLRVQVAEDSREWDSGIEPTPDYRRYYAQSWADTWLARPTGKSLQQLTDRATETLVGCRPVRTCRRPIPRSLSGDCSELWDWRSDAAGLPCRD
ncbi:histidine phosphatase family protein [Nocardia sp. NBC_01009]|uniref:histidine phosphatase family protein n=1 Tax=Nocardia sp. NBC_01009 TaxID=2975996 RepID=UPI0038706558